MTNSIFRALGLENCVKSNWQKFGEKTNMGVVHELVFFGIQLYEFSTYPNMGVVHELVLPIVRGCHEIRPFYPLERKIEDRDL